MINVPVLGVYWLIHSKWCKSHNSFSVVPWLLEINKNEIWPLFFSRWCIVPDRTRQSPEKKIMAMLGCLILARFSTSSQIGFAHHKMSSTVLKFLASELLFLSYGSSRKMKQREQLICPAAAQCSNWAHGTVFRLTRDAWISNQNMKWRSSFLFGGITKRRAGTWPSHDFS